MVDESDVVTLIQRARVDGDASAMDAILRRYRNYLELLARLHHSNQLQAKSGDSDLVQETCLRFAASIGQFRGHTEEELTAWLRSIMARAATNLRRRYLGSKKRDCRREQQLKQQFDQSSATLHFGQIVGKSETPSAIMSRHEQAVRLADALQRLPNDYREVIIQHHFQGQSLDQVAKSMGRSLAATRKLWSRALLRFRDEFSP